MPFEQDRMRNPYGMDEACPRCDALVETRHTIVHGFGDVTAEFFFVAETPTERADERGHPVTEPDDGYGLIDLLDAGGFLTDETDAADEPVLENAFVTHLTRCRHPDRAPTDVEVRNCEPFLNAELRSINPEILVPVGQRPLRFLAAEYTTTDPRTLSIDEVHATELRGRGFELVPSIEPDRMDDTTYEVFAERLAETMGRDYRQTKGRRRR